MENMILLLCCTHTGSILVVKHLKNVVGTGNTKKHVKINGIKSQAYLLSSIIHIFEHATNLYLKGFL